MSNELASKIALLEEQLTKLRQEIEALTKERYNASLEANLRMINNTYVEKCQEYEKLTVAYAKYKSAIAMNSEKYLKEGLANGITLLTHEEQEQYLQWLMHAKEILDMVIYEERKNENYNRGIVQAIVRAHANILGEYMEYSKKR